MESHPLPVRCLRAAWIFVCCFLATGRAEETVLQAGDVIEYQFADLPFFAHGSGGEQLLGSSVLLTLVDDLSDSGDALEVQFLEGGLTGKPVVNRLRQGGSSPSSRVSFAGNDAWKSLNGAFRLTVIRGSIKVQSAEVPHVRQSGITEADYFGQLFSVGALLRPNLSISQNGSSVVVKWSARFANFVTEAKPALDSNAPWEKVTSVASSNQDELVVTELLTADGKFYRLRAP